MISEYELLSAKASFQDTPDNMAKIDELAEQQGVTRSAVIRSLIHEALETRRTSDPDDF